MKREELLKSDQELDRSYKEFSQKIIDAFEQRKKVSIDANELIRVYCDCVSAKKTVIKLLLDQL